MNQPELPGMPRARKPLIQQVVETVRVRVPLRVALAVEANPEGAVRALEQAASLNELNRKATFPLGGAERSAWRIDRPAKGLWEVTDHKTGSKVRGPWWFGGVFWVMSDNPNQRGAGGIHHDDFVKQYAWRGLAERPTVGYDCPPYDLLSLPKGCRLNVATAAQREPEQAAIGNAD